MFDVSETDASGLKWAPHLLGSVCCAILYFFHLCHIWCTSSSCAFSQLFQKATRSDSLLHFPDTFSCPHSCQYLLQSARQLKKTKQWQKQKKNWVGLLYKSLFMSWAGRRAAAFHGLNQGQQEGVELPQLSDECAGNFSHFMRTLYRRWYYKRSTARVFVRTRHAHMQNLLSASTQRFQGAPAAVDTAGDLFRIVSTSGYTEPGCMEHEGPLHAQRVPFMGGARDNELKINKPGIGWS